MENHPARLMDSVRYCFANYAKFDGRARRPEFWYFCLFNFTIGLAIDLLGGNPLAVDLPSDPLGMTYGLLVLVPSLAVGARRLHDTGHSGWWQLIWFVPVIGWIVLIIWLASRGDEKDNAFGPA